MQLLEGYKISGGEKKEFRRPIMYLTGWVDFYCTLCSHLKDISDQDHKAHGQRQEHHDDGKKKKTQLRKCGLIVANIVIVV